ncbi:MAG TPA: histidine kinase [Candidatus Limnocylindrales bacterium]
MAVNTSIAPARRVPRADVARLGLSALVVVLLATALAFVAYRLSTPSDGTDVGGVGNPFGADGVRVVARDHLGAGSIGSGDVVVALLGRPTEAWAAALLDPATTRPLIGVGNAIVYTVERNGTARQASVNATPFDGIAALGQDWGVVVLALAVLIAGAYLFARRPAEPAAQALLVAGTGMFASTVPWALGLQVTDIAAATGFWLYAATAGLAYTLFWCGALHFALVFPRPVPFAAGRHRLVTIAYGIPIAAQLVWIVGAGLASGRVLPALQSWMDGQAVLQVGTIVTAIALMSYSYWRLVDPISRSQLRWIAGAVALAGLSGLVFWFAPQLIIGQPLIPRSAVALLALPFPAALALAINRHHLFELDTVVNRSLVYGGLTAGVIATYAATVALIGGIIPGNAPFAVALLGTGAVAVVALPLHDRLQRAVNRLMYGDRDEPDEALRRLGRRLEASLDPHTVLSTLVETVADALRSPYVAIELQRDGGSGVEAAHGAVPVDGSGVRGLIHVPIVYRGTSIGRLVLSLRAANEPFSRADERLLADLARQAAPAVEAVRLTADLRRSREELVATREEERRRLRHDLHDELGPALAGSMMKLGAARSLMAADPSRASGLLDDLEGDIRGMIEEIRRIARDLRPPALDELGLAGVLRMRIAAFETSSGDHGLRASFDVPNDLPALPAAVEVAALRITLEAMTNVARHSGASHVCVSLGLDGEWLVLTVRDDGVGIGPATPPGVGLTSMRLRADELGGSLDVAPAVEGGTIVTARLPVTPAEPA